MFSKKHSRVCAVPYIMPSLDIAESVAVNMDIIEEPISDELFKSLRLEEIEREAYEKGFEAGQKAGFEMGEQKALLLIQRLENIITDIIELRQRELKNLEKQVFQLSLAFAKRIILKEISLNPDILTNIVKEALMRLQRTGQIIIKIHPSLNEIFIKNKASLLGISPDIVFELDAKSPLFGAEIIGPEEIIMTDAEEQFRNILDEIGVQLAEN